MKAGIPSSRRSRKTSGSRSSILPPLRICSRRMSVSAPAARRRMPPSPDMVGHPFSHLVFLSLSLLPTAHGGHRLIARSSIPPSLHHPSISPPLSLPCCAPKDSALALVGSDRPPPSPPFFFSLSLFPLPLMEDVGRRIWYPAAPLDLLEDVGHAPTMHRRMPPTPDVVGHPLLLPYFSLSSPSPLTEDIDRSPDLVSRHLFIILLYLPLSLFHAAHRRMLPSPSPDPVGHPLLPPSFFSLSLFSSSPLMEDVGHRIWHPTVHRIWHPAHRGCWSPDLASAPSSFFYISPPLFPAAHRRMPPSPDLVRFMLPSVLPKRRVNWVSKSFASMCLLKPKVV